MSDLCRTRVDSCWLVLTRVDLLWYSCVRIDLIILEQLKPSGRKENINKDNCGSYFYFWLRPLLRLRVGRLICITKDIIQRGRRLYASNCSLLLAFPLLLSTTLSTYKDVRDDTYMTSMKIVQFSGPPTPVSIYVQNSSTPLTLDVEFQMNTVPPFQMITNLLKKKHNPRMTFMCYQVLPSGWPWFSVSTH